MPIMEDKFVINIGRQLGSGGKAVGEAIAQRLGIGVYDKQLINLAAEQSGLCPEVFERVDEKESRNLFSTLVAYLRSPFVGSEYAGSNVLSNDALFKIQSDVIRDIAARESCVIVGRCADYVLRDDPNVALVNLFVHAPLAARIRRESARTNTTPAEAEKRIRQVDKERAAYYNFFSSKRWGDAQAYDLCVNTDGLEISEVAKLVLRYLELRGLR